LTLVSENKASRQVLVVFLLQAYPAGSVASLLKSDQTFAQWNHETVRLHQLFPVTLIGKSKVAFKFPQPNKEVCELLCAAWLNPQCSTLVGKQW